MHVGEHSAPPTRREHNCDERNERRGASKVVSIHRSTFLVTEQHSGMDYYASVGDPKARSQLRLTLVDAAARAAGNLPGGYDLNRELNPDDDILLPQLVALWKATLDTIMLAFPSLFPSGAPQSNVEFLMRKSIFDVFLYPGYSPENSSCIRSTTKTSSGTTENICPSSSFSFAPAPTISTYPLGETLEQTAQKNHPWREDIPGELFPQGLLRSGISLEVEQRLTACAAHSDKGALLYFAADHAGLQLLHPDTQNWQDAAPPGVLTALLGRAACMLPRNLLAPIESRLNGRRLDSGSACTHRVAETRMPRCVISVEIYPW